MNTIEQHIEPAALLPVRYPLYMCIEGMAHFASLLQKLIALCLYLIAYSTPLQPVRKIKAMKIMQRCNWSIGTLYLYDIIEICML